jgi:hypothetical protein
MKLLVEIDVMPLDEISAQAFILRAHDSSGEVVPTPPGDDEIPSTARATFKIVNDALRTHAETAGIEVCQTMMEIRHAVDGEFPEVVRPSQPQYNADGSISLPGLGTP